MTREIKCIIVDDEPVAREILRTHLSRINDIQIVAECKNAVEAFKVINSQAVDLVFLDINMPDISGLSFAKSMTREIRIIFTTAYRDYAIDGFDLQAVDYLLKPISYERLLQSVNKFKNDTGGSNRTDHEVAKADKSECLFVRSDRKMIRINFKEVRFIESISDYIKIHLDQRMVITRETLSNIEARLPSQSFIRIHRSYIVAVEFIESFTKEYVEIEKRQIPISRGYRDTVLSRLE